MRSHTPLPQLNVTQSSILKFIFSLFVVAFSASFAFATPLEFKHPPSLYEADRYKQRVEQRGQTDNQPLAEWIRRAIVARQNDPELARRHYESALKLDSDKATLWLELAKTIKSISLSKPKNYRRYQFYRDGTAASYNAYRFAKDKAIKAQALAVLGDILRARSLWRPALNALKASIDLDKRPEVVSLYQKLRAEKGFRITNYKINSDLATPRLCINFSEKLFARGTDYSTFLKVNAEDPDGVRVERRQICIDGFKHGETYKVTLRQGLPSIVGEQLLKTVDLDIYVRDRSPSVRFSSKAYVLPKNGQRGLPLMSVNTEKAGLAIYHVGDRNLVSTVLDGQFQSSIGSYEADQLSNKFGAEIWKGEVDISTKLNKDVTTAVPIKQALKNMKPGLYVVRAWPKNSKYGRSRGSSQWFIVSDIGLASIKAKNGVYGFVKSITTTKPMRGVNVRLIARNNEILGSTASDKNGMVRFDAALTRGKGGNRPALLVAEGADGDYGFVDLSRSAFDLTDRGVGGRETPQSLDGFLFVERGVYRPGEEVHLTALMRDQTAKAVNNIPLTLVITRPDGKEHKRISLPDMGAGGRSYSFALITSAMTGTWRVKAFGDVKARPIGSTSFLVEDYVPERMELSVKGQNEKWSRRQMAELLVSGRYLYGAAAANHQLKGEVTIRKRASGLKNYKGFDFGLADEKFLNIQKPLNNLGLLNEKGKTTLKLQLPEFSKPSKPIEAHVNLRLLEPGGRQVVRAITVPVANEKAMIGIKKQFAGKVLEENAVAKFEIVSLTAKGAQSADNLAYELLEIQKDYQWYSQNGQWRFEPVTYTNRVAKGVINTLEDGTASLQLPVKRGQYRLEVISKTFNQLAASVNFSAGWYGSRDADTPDMLEIAADKSTYISGDKALITVKPKAAGRTLVAIVNEKILDIKEVEVGAKGAEIPFTVSDKWGVGAYVIAMHYHKLEDAQSQMPGRAIGVKWLKLDEAPRKLAIKLEVAKTLTGQDTLSVPVEVKGLSRGEKAYVTLAAVDEGILSLTSYQTPKPDTYYYGQRRLLAEIRDVYGHLINGMGGAPGRIRFGGDASGLALQGAPNTIKPVALYSGIVELDSNGKAKIDFVLPQFNGNLRLMAAAWSKDKLGSHEQSIIVRDKVVVLASTPLFLTKGDETRLFLSIDNVSGPEGDYSLDASSNKHIDFVKSEFEKPLNLIKGKRLNLALTMKGSKIGLGKINLSLRHKDGYQVRHSYDLVINAPQPDASWRTVKKLTPNGGKLTLTSDVFADLIPETAKGSITIGNLAGIDVAGIFDKLHRYPYGCAEQTTSRAMPLLYVSKIAPRYSQSIAKEIPRRIKGAVARLAALQNSGGGFGLWSPHSTDMWLTAYVTDFLTRAREQKFEVNETMIKAALSRLKNSVNFASDFSKGGEDIAYALYVLSRNGEANIGDLRYYADAKIKNFSTAIAQAQIGASLAMYGDKARAASAFKAAYTTMSEAEDETGTSYYRRDYGTRLRDRAALLALSAEAKTTAISRPELIKAVMQVRQEKVITSTQENAWLLLAANALEVNDRDILLGVNDLDHKGEYRKSFTPQELAAKPISLVNKGVDELTAIMTIHGSAENAPPAVSKNGIGLSRRFYTLSGKEISLINVKQNQRVVVVITIQDEEHKGGRLLLTDYMPAGFMIENPSLVTGTSLKHFKWLKLRHYPTHQSFRDDQFVASFNLFTNRRRSDTREIQVAYIMRAAHDGRFIHPAAMIEDMYRPSRYARTNAQNVTIRK